MPDNAAAGAVAANTRVWDALFRTDPKATKGFTRGGGFKGTAIKPIYMTEQMTKLFGPCGDGWGMTEPAYMTHTLTEPAGQVAIYCRVGVWFRTIDGEMSAHVWGVGGDTLLKKRKDGSYELDDEAYKKAYTDALSNAFKQLGMSADIHMGLFEDSKYVAEAGAEAAASARQEQEAEDGDWAEKIIRSLRSCQSEEDRSKLIVEAKPKYEAVKERNRGLAMQVMAVNDEVKKRLAGGTNG